VTSNRAEIDGLRADVRTLLVLVRGLVNKETQYQNGIKHRDTILCELVKAIGPLSENTFKEAWAIIDEQHGHEAPVGCEHIVTWFQDHPEMVISFKQIGRRVRLKRTTFP
jgi:hypothetical protein